MSQRHEINPFTTTFRHDLLPVILIPGGNVGNQDGNAGNQGGNAGNQGGNAGNRGGNARNIIKMESL